jgi:hypothetical protein
MTVTYIRWKDASHGMDEYDVSQMVLSELEEVGWLVTEDDDCVTLSMEHEENSKSRRLWLTIPKVNVIERRDAEFDKAFAKRRRK